MLSLGWITSTHMNTSLLFTVQSLWQLNKTFVYRVLTQVWHGTMVWLWERALGPDKLSQGAHPSGEPRQAEPGGPGFVLFGWTVVWPSWVIVLQGPKSAPLFLLSLVRHFLCLGHQGLSHIPPHFPQHKLAFSPFFLFLDLSLVSIKLFSLLCHHFPCQEILPFPFCSCQWVTPFEFYVLDSVTCVMRKTCLPWR